MKMTNLSLIFICAFFALFVIINALIAKNNDKEAQVHKIAIMLCELDNPLTSCENISLNNMKHKFDKQKYWQESKEIFNDEAKISSLKDKIQKIKDFKLVVQAEKQKIEQEQKEKVLAQIKNEFKNLNKGNEK